jgi:hypothetical protein
MSESKEDSLFHFRHFSIDTVLGVTIFNTVLICIFGYGIIFKEMSGYYWFAYLGISFVFLFYMACCEKWKEFQENS